MRGGGGGGGRRDSLCVWGRVRGVEGRKGGEGGWDSVSGEFSLLVGENGGLDHVPELAYRRVNVLWRGKRVRVCV